MSNDKVRRQITHEAARLLYRQQESEFHVARLKAARRLGFGWVKACDLPTNQEIRAEIQSLARMADGPRDDNQNKWLELSLRNGDAPRQRDRFAVYRSLLAPLETVMQSFEFHPEGDALYHSLQVFELARDALPYDEEFQTAALLHDIGKAIDPRDHIGAALDALDGHITERTAWLIEHHSEAGALRDGTLGARARRRLEASEDFDDLMLLCDCDRRGRQKGVRVGDIEDALEHLHELSSANGAA